TARVDCSEPSDEAHPPPLLLPHARGTVGLSCDTGDDEVDRDQRFALRPLLPGRPRMTATSWSPTDSAYQARLLRAHAELREHSDLRGGGTAVREPVLASWRRSLAAAPTADAVPTRPVLEGEELAVARQEHLFSAVLPLLRSRLIDPAVEAGLMVALGDARGRLLWVEGRPQLISRADDMGFA